MEKTKEEIGKIKRAVKLALKCFEYIKKQIKEGMTEIEIAKKMDEYMLKNGASKLAFETIVGSGENSSLIHSTPTERLIQKNDIILLDFGCVVDEYCSDISRTIFIGKPKKKWLEVYDIVEKAYKEGLEKIESGMTCKKADEISRKIITQKGYNFAHALGHGVGKEVHENPTISPKSEEILKDGTVFTIEPGIYIENEFGVRIENTVVLENGKVQEL